ELKKKVTLLRHFKNYMMTDVLERKDGASAGESSLKPASLAAKVTYAPGQVPFAAWRNSLVGLSRIGLSQLEATKPSAPVR
ncbi:CCRP1, partial [Symbiodinium necroappetens]